MLLYLSLPRWEKTKWAAHPDRSAALSLLKWTGRLDVRGAVTGGETGWVTGAWRGQGEHEASLRRGDIKPILMRGRPLIAGFERIEIEPIGGKGLSTDVEL